VQSASAPDVAEVLPAKPGKCWKFSIDTHATKDCKAQHYSLVCDTSTHPTLRCPTLKLPKPQAFVGGPCYSKVMAPEKSWWRIVDVGAVSPCAW
jgi:hypothetical protein